MQLADDVALADAIDGAERKIRWRLLVDWNRDGLYRHPLSDLSAFLDDIDADRDLASDLPAEVGLLQGAASAELNVRLAGAARVTEAGVLDVTGREMSIAKLLSPYRSDSPLYGVTKLGCEIRFEVGLMSSVGEKIIRQFTGKIRKVDVDRSTGRATISALDGSEAFRRPITLGRGAMSLKEFNKHKHDPRKHPFYINSQLVIDQIARHNGYYASPPSHPTSIYAMTCHGGFAAEMGETRTPVGRTTTTYTPPYWKPGAHELLAPTGTWSQYATIPGLATSHYQAWEGTGLAMSAYVYWPGSVTGGTTTVDVLEAELGTGILFVLTVSNAGTVRARFKKGATTSSGPEMDLVPGWNSVGGYLQFEQHTALNGGPVEIHTYAGGLSSSNRFTSYGGVPAVGDDDWHRSVRTAYRTAVGVTNWSLFLVSPSNDLTAGDWLPAPADFVPTSSIAIGLNELAYVPDTAFEDSWSLLQDVVSAEAGLCGFTEDGFFFFRNRTMANADTTVRKVISNLRALKSLSITSSADGVRNVVTVTSQDGFMGSETTIWEPEDPAQLDSDPGETIFDIELEPNSYTSLDSRIPARTQEQWQDTETEVIKGFVAVRVDDNEVEVTSQVRAWFAQTGPRIGELLIDNDKSYPVRFALPTAEDSDPEVESTSAAFRISGYELVEGAEQVVAYRDESSIALHGERTLALPKTVWLQSKASGQVIAESILEFTDEPRPLLQDIPVVGDPRVQLGDLVQVSDPDGLGVINGYVVKINRRLSRSDGLADTYAIRAA